jgi:hypothetical protein
VIRVVYLIHGDSGDIEMVDGTGSKLLIKLKLRGLSLDISIRLSF